MAARAARVILAGDIGGTKSLLGLFEDGKLLFESNLSSRAFGDFESLLASFLHSHRRKTIEQACFGLAGPVEGRQVKLTNLPWTVDLDALGDRFGIPRIRAVNDFAAAARGIDSLHKSDLATLQAGEPLAGAPKVVLGAGTGFGVAFLVEGKILSSEGGHMAFAPQDREQLALWRHLRARFGRVELEHVLSGPGLARIKELAGDDGTAIGLFIACYGAAAGDLALSVMARGGVYVAGGVARGLLDRLAEGGFVAAFNDKGEFSQHAKRMPVHVVVNERLGLLGAAACATQDLEASIP